MHQFQIQKLAWFDEWFSLRQSKDFAPTGMAKDTSPEQLANEVSLDPVARNISPELIAKDIIRLSDIYVKKNGDHSKIWSDEKLRLAYLSYFLPLNALRLSHVTSSAIASDFLAGLEHLIDFGSGPGTTDLVFSHQQQIQFKSQHFIEKSPAAIELHKNNLNAHSHFKLSETSQSNKFKKWSHNFSGSLQKNTLAVFSYALNEVAALPMWAFSAEALLILEPSTQKAGRNLQQLRQDLINKGYFIWAPCTHHELCPLLTKSKTDWCHTRIHVELPKTVAKIEAHLPIKNQTLTFSYLLAKRTPPVRTGAARIIGDTLFEKGKVRQAICRGPEREFLSWLTRHGEPEVIERGSLFDIPTDAVKKGFDIRLNHN